MSVNFNVRRVNKRLRAALTNDPQLTAALCDLLVDFDAQRFEEDFLRERPAPVVRRARS